VRVFVTNDDGVGSPGLVALVKALTEEGHEVVAVAPARECSGTSAAVGAIHELGEVEVKEVASAGLNGATVMAADAYPALIVIMACTEAFGRAPEVVVSGINRGLNVGYSVMHSGTVGAALTATHFSIPSLAVSIKWDDAGQVWESAARVAAEIVPTVAGRKNLVLNVNVPNLPLEEIKGARVARLCGSGLIRKVVRRPGAGGLVIEINEERADAGDTDVEVVRSGRVAVTALSPVSQAVDASAAEVASKLERGLFSVLS
jgi:5'-nucleotidase